MLGYAQENWLGLGLAQSKAKWNLIAQDVLMAQLRQKMPDGDFGLWTDDWDGFPASRRRLLQRIAQTRVPNPVVIGGDIHAFFANDLRLDFDDPKSPVWRPNLLARPYRRPDRPTIHLRHICPTI